MSESIPNYYSITPAPVRYSKEVCANAKLLYGEISALSNKEGFCYASNKYFSDLYDVESGTISGWISQLNKAGFIRVEILEGYQRKIYLKDLSVPLPQKSGGAKSNNEPPSDKNHTPPPIKIAHNITSNNTKNNIDNKEQKISPPLRRDNDPFAIVHDTNTAIIIYDEIKNYFVREYKTKPQADSIACANIASKMIYETEEEIREDVRNKILAFLYDPYWANARPSPKLLSKAWDQLSEKNIPKHVKNNLDNKLPDSTTEDIVEDLVEIEVIPPEQAKANLDEMERIFGEMP